MMGVPTFYTRLLREPGLTRQATAHMRLFISGSAPLLAETHVDFETRTGHAILERYGMTETNMNTSNPYEGARNSRYGWKTPARRRRQNYRSRRARSLPEGEIGMIEVRGPNVFKGYWRMPEKTAEEFRPDGFFITGDLGRIDENGYLSIVGRGKDLIISGGFNIYPKEVESEIDSIPGVIESRGHRPARMTISAKVSPLWWSSRMRRPPARRPSWPICKPVLPSLNCRSAFCLSNRDLSQPRMRHLAQHAGLIRNAGIEPHVIEYLKTPPRARCWKA
jgi:acyl-CoA synthetase (AMP-forming)/AMP-acid ligase II